MLLFVSGHLCETGDAVAGGNSGEGGLMLGAEGQMWSVAKSF